MAGGYTVAADGDFGVLVQRMNAMDRRLAELERPTGSQTAEALAALEAAVLQLNNAVATSTSGRTFIVGGGDPDFEAQTARTDFLANIIEFPRPAWATTATVFAFSRSVARGDGGSFLTFNDLRLRVGSGGVYTDGGNFGEQATAPPFGEIRLAGAIQPEIPYITTQVGATSTVTRTWSVTPDADARVELRLTKPFTGAGIAFTLQTSATVFWSAP